MNRFVLLIVWPSLAAGLWIANYYFPNDHINRLFLTFSSLSIIHIIFKVILERNLSKKIAEKKTRYSFRKIISILYVAVFLASLVAIWLNEVQNITVALGLASAGIAFALQDVLKNFAGGILIYVNRTYNIGDRIDIDGKIGDVIDIGILNTTLFEIGEWSKGDRATGRLLMIPNGLLLTSMVKNYTKDHNFIWDEIAIPLSFNSDWKKASELFLNIAKQETKSYAEEANKSVSSLDEKYYVAQQSGEPTMNINLTSDSIDLFLNYTVNVRERSAVKTRIVKAILEEIGKADDIDTSATQVDIVGFPEGKL